MNADPQLALSEPVSDEVRKTTCYMCACRCGIDVHLKDGKIRYIEGNRDHPVNKGVLCAKGSAGIMTQVCAGAAQFADAAHRPARLWRVQADQLGRGAGTRHEWMGEVRARDPKKFAFFTGRDQSQSLTGLWAQQFGTPNYAAHGGFCSVNMAAAGIMTLGGGFWEFGSPDWERTKLFVMFGVAEDHDSNPLKIGISKLKKRGAQFVSVNPVRTGYSSVADSWIGIRPGTDGLLVLSLIHELLKARRIDVDYLVRYTNAPWLVIDAPGTAEHGLFARDADGKPLIFETVTEQVVASGAQGARAALSAAFTHWRTAARRRRRLHCWRRPISTRAMRRKRSPGQTGVSAATIKGLAARSPASPLTRRSRSNSHGPT
jgi:anaerobic selenocysteine-containing dehydrogenase